MIPPQPNVRPSTRPPPSPLLRHWGEETATRLSTASHQDHVFYWQTDGDLTPPFAAIYNGMFSGGVIWKLPLRDVLFQS